MMAGPAAQAPTLTRGRRALFAAIALALGLMAALVLTEVTLRLLRKPVPAPSATTADGGHEPTTEPDPRRGWKCRPGAFSFPPLVPGGPPIHDRVLADGRRATETTTRPGRPIVALVGCSYTHGVGLSDEETYAWKLQEMFPEVEVRNYGTPGYGTYQSLLTLEDVFQGPRKEWPALVLHGHIWFHPWRNVASSQWLGSILRYRADGAREFGEVPYATLDAMGQLVRHPPDHFQTFPLGQSLLTMGLLESAYNRLRCRPRERQYRRVTDAILEAMRDLCARHEAGFVDLILTADPEAKAREIAFCQESGIDVADCSRFPIGPEWTLVGDPHPNALLNTLWAEDIARVLGDRLKSLKTRD